MRLRENESNMKERKDRATVNSGGGVIYGSACPITMHREGEREREREGVLIWVLGIQGVFY